MKKTIPKWNYEQIDLWWTQAALTNPDIINLPLTRALISIVVMGFAQGDALFTPFSLQKRSIKISARYVDIPRQNGLVGHNLGYSIDQ
jgi:hypothetical protein